MGEPLDVIAPAPGVDDVRGTALELEIELRVAGDTRAEVGRQRDRFIE